MKDRLCCLGLALARTLLACLSGATIYAIWNVGYATKSANLPLWLAAVGATTLPVALAGMVLARLPPPAGRPWSTVGAVLTYVAGVIASISLFEIYMTELSPATNWTRAGLLPAASFTSGFALEKLRWPSPSSLWEPLH